VRSECSKSEIRGADLSVAGQFATIGVKFDADFMGISRVLTDELRRGVWQMLSANKRFF
jgi:hypothetical protein